MPGVVWPLVLSTSFPAQPLEPRARMSEEHVWWSLDRHADGLLSQHQEAKDHAVLQAFGKERTGAPGAVKVRASRASCELNGKLYAE